ncbi:MAG: HmuY family protein [Prevotellaceae bacterium]|jgi:hypothetical protein|nr:HmuY family protein [Prevotellaceae bacterium]
MKPYFTAALGCTMLLLASCVSYDAAPFTGKVLPRISGYTTGVTNDWIYFNLRTGEIFNLRSPNQDIAEGAQLNRLDWDLAFCGYRLRTNSGSSGSGRGGALDLGYGNYERWTRADQLPAGAEWTVDDSTVSITMSEKDWYHYLLENGMNFEDNPWFDPNNGPQETTTSANPLLAEAMSFAGPPPSYIPSYHTYVVRTADGRHYFKLQLVSWYNAGDPIGSTGGTLSYYCDELP